MARRKFTTRTQFAPKHIKKFAKICRHRLSRHEMMFLRRLALANVASFDFQVRIGVYIADFVFPEKMLIIELDGSSHDERKEHDEKRDRLLTNAGFAVWRIANSEASEWSLSKITEYQRPMEGRGYVDAIRWANAKHQDMAARDRGKNPPSLRTKEERQDEFYKRLIAKTEQHHKAEKERREMFAAEREGRPIIILKGAGKWRRRARTS